MKDREKSEKLKWFSWLKWIVTAIVLIFLALTILRLDIQSLLDSIKQISPWTVFLLFGLQIVTQLLINLQWHQITKSFTSPIGFGEMLYVNAQAEIIHIAPGGHIGCDVFRAVQIHRCGDISGEQSASVVAIQKLFSLSAFFTISLVSMGFFIGQVPWLQETHFQILLYGLLTLFLILLGCVFVIPYRMSAYLNKRWKKEARFSWVNKLQSFVINSLNHVAYLGKNTKILIRLILIAFAIWILYPLKLYLLAFQLMPDVSALHVTAAAFLSYTVAMIPIFPGGLGGFEATMTGLLLSMGFAQGGALVITVMFRFATFWFVILMNLVYLVGYKGMYLQNRKQKHNKGKL